MAATTAASIHAPLTAAVLVFELSGDYPIVLPLLLVTVVATGISRAVGSESIYEAELHQKGVRWEVTLEGRQTTSRVATRRPPASSPTDDGRRVRATTAVTEPRPA
jgi:CIC family chloride channel protein